ncbi:hypothetical protein [Leptobacterium sp. I13]|uniref:hypothetical protein n=1 Tax=Leptobacterium meishanense TaxID=3128904 RepID=UPI0030EEC56C
MRLENFNVQKLDTENLRRVNGGDIRFPGWLGWLTFAVSVIDEFNEVYSEETSSSSRPWNQ